MSSNKYKMITLDFSKYKKGKFYSLEFDVLYDEVSNKTLYKETMEKHLSRINRRMDDLAKLEESYITKLTEYQPDLVKKTEDRFSFIT